MARTRKNAVPVRERAKGDQLFLNAERDFIYLGLEIPEIAKKYSIPLGTVNNWSYIHSWIALRMKRNRELNNRLFEETAQQSCEILQESFAIAKDALVNIHESFNYIHSLKSDRDDKPIVLKHLSSYKELIRLAKEAIAIYSLAKPDISQDQGEKLLASLQKVKEEVDKNESVPTAGISV